MSGNGTFSLLWGKILRSSIWLESKETRIVWITMLALKDKDGLVLGSLRGLAHTARVEPEECAEAIQKFLSPDPDSSTPGDDGRRIEVVPGGWHILNHEKYQFSTEARRLMWAENKRRQRMKEADPTLVTEESAKAKAKEFRKRVKAAKAAGKAAGATEAIDKGFKAAGLVQAPAVDPSSGSSELPLILGAGHPED